MTTKTPAPEPDDKTEADKAWALLREPFPESAIGLLPKQVKRDDQNKMECSPENGRRVSKDGRYCGGYHAFSTHLDFVGHAAVTDRLLKVDPMWNWEPMALDSNGLPLVVNGTLWIRLTVLGVTRLGFGDAPGKRDATKELIGDALRNAAMRFGVALDLWAKGDLLAADEERSPEAETRPAPVSRAQAAPRDHSPQPAAASPAGGQQARPNEEHTDWVAETAQTGSTPEVRALYQRAKNAGHLATAITVDGKVQTVGEYITAYGIAVKKADEERQKAMQKIARNTDPGTGEIQYESYPGDNEPI